MKFDFTHVNKDFVNSRKNESHSAPYIINKESHWLKNTHVNKDLNNRRT